MNNCAERLKHYHDKARKNLTEVRLSHSLALRALDRDAYESVEILELIRACAATVARPRPKRRNRFKWIRRGAGRMLPPLSNDATAPGRPALAVRYVTPMSKARVRTIGVCPSPMDGNLTKLDDI